MTGLATFIQEKIPTFVTSPNAKSEKNRPIIWKRGAPGG